MRGSMRFQGLPWLSSTVFLALSGSCSGGRMAVDRRIALGLREGHAHARTARVFSSICNLFVSYCFYFAWILVLVRVMMVGTWVAGGHALRYCELPMHLWLPCGPD
jgi:hypothetical protein